MIWERMEPYTEHMFDNNKMDSMQISQACSGGKSQAKKQLETKL